MVTLILNSTFAFSDLDETQWAYSNIMSMQEKGIISGFDDGTFKPNMSLTREQVIVMLVNSLNLKNAKKSDFRDIENRWSSDYIKTAGYCLVDDNITIFKPDRPVVREDFAMAIVKAKGLENVANDDNVLNIFTGHDFYHTLRVYNL